MARSLADRQRAHEQQKARLAEQEAKIRLAERKARTKRLIEAGALVEKASLLDLEVNALYGALLSLRDNADTKKQVEQWSALGGRAFAREARARDEGKEPVL
ncbi:MAG: conjugal transfer protein TraD, partial [Paracraurococcus sp.]